MTKTLPNGSPTGSAELPDLLTDFRDGVLTIAFNRPDTSIGFSLEMSVSLEQTLMAARDDERIRALVLTSAGRNFSARADFDLVEQNFAACRSSREDAYALEEPAHDLTEAVENFSKPVIAAVNGAAAGMGLAMALAADIIVAAEDTIFVYAYTKLALPGDAGVTRRLVQRVGLGRALEIGLFDEPLDARKALNWGVVNFVAPKGDMALDFAKSLANKLSVGPAVALAGVKTATRANRSVDDHRTIEINKFIDAARHDDVYEGLSALHEKRKPKFHGAPQASRDQLE